MKILIWIVVIPHLLQFSLIIISPILCKCFPQQIEKWVM